MSGARAEGIDNAAHIGGLVSGIILGIIYLLTDRFATKKTSTLFISITEISFVLIFTALFAWTDIQPAGRFYRNQGDVGEWYT